ncbi:MAG: fluoride efflux transporter CrcB [Alphaproteobacteria bacterium]|nr:fluoride efflux transporter CrcB [Alphaproteobacteria bacterium]
MGAITRHGLNSGIAALIKVPFPFGILCINILGSFLIGVFVAIFAGAWNPGKLGQMFIVTGFLGGFTTFSTFSLDTMTLMTRGEYGMAALYALASVVLSLLAVFAGSYLAWKLMA